MRTNAVGVRSVRRAVKAWPSPERSCSPGERCASAASCALSREAHLSLLKIQFGAIEDRDKQRGASPILRDSTFVAMMQAANLREGNYVVACTG
jgi:hypothetical protein